MKKIFSLAMILFIAACTPHDKYDINSYYSAPDQDKILSGIVTYLFTAPPQTKMEDRFLPKNKNYYSFAATKFSIDKYYVADDGTHYYYIIRPASDPREKRGVGGSFKMDNDFKMKDFKETFVTPSLPEADVKGRCAFLFDEMVKGTLDQYLVMDSFVQWPNNYSYYDTLTYEWKLRADSIK